MKMEEQFKKSQSEMVGLVIIFIIIAIALMFLVVMTSNPKQNTILADNQRITSDFTNSLISTTIDCDDNRNFYQLAVDCEQGIKLACDDGVMPCQKLNNTIKFIMEESLNKFYNYTMFEFILAKSIPGSGVKNSVFIDVVVGNTSNTVTYSAQEPYPLPYGRIINLEAKLCAGGCPPEIGAS